MAIEFHCNHCNKVVRSPESDAGKTDSCPFCGGPVYIPRSPDEEGELDLAPLDRQDENRRRQAFMEDLAFQRRLLADREPPADRADRSTARGPAPREGPARRPPREAAFLSPKDINLRVVEYIVSMSEGRLEKAESLIAQLSPHRNRVFALLDELATADHSAYGLPALPRPVLMGFLKQLRTRL